MVNKKYTGLNVKQAKPLTILKKLDELKEFIVFKDNFHDYEIDLDTFIKELIQREKEREKVSRKQSKELKELTNKVSVLTKFEDYALDKLTKKQIIDYYRK